MGSYFIMFCDYSKQVLSFSHVGTLVTPLVLVSDEFSISLLAVLFLE